MADSSDLSSVASDGSRPDFFDRKRPWSRVKDGVLYSYMRPYLAKVRALRQPIFIVDAFAGPGTFRDGPGNRPEDGSPMIIGESLREYAPGEVRGFFFNNRAAHHHQLKKAFAERGLSQHCTCMKGDARDLLRRFADYVERTAPQATVFVFLDPFGASGVEFEVIQRLLSRPKASTEFLINIRGSALHRMAAINLNARTDTTSGLDWGDVDPAVDRPPGWEDPDHDKAWLIEVEEGDEDIRLQLADEEEFLSTESDPCERWHPSLDIVFGDRMRWLPHLLNFNLEASERIRRAMADFRAGLREHTRFAGSCEVRRKPNGPAVHYITFCSRSDHALVLMNDAMLKAREQSEYAAWGKKDDLFAVHGDWRDYRGDYRRAINSATLRQLGRYPAGLSREHLTAQIIGAEFVQYTKSEITDTLREMVRTGQLEAINENPKARFNERTLLRLGQTAMF